MATLDELPNKQARAITALMNHNTIPEAAEAVGIGARTLCRWMHENTAFQAAYRNAKREALSHTIHTLQRTTPLALATLVRVMQDTDAPTGSRVAAARTVFELAFRAVELEDLDARIAALEQAAGVGL